MGRVERVGKSTCFIVTRVCVFAMCSKTSADHCKHSLDEPEVWRRYRVVSLTSLCAFGWRESFSFILTLSRSSRLDLRLQRALLTKTMQAGRHVGREIKYEESDAQSHPRCQRQKGVRDNHGAGGTYGFEVAK